MSDARSPHILRSVAAPLFAAFAIVVAAETLKPAPRRPTAPQTQVAVSSPAKAPLAPTARGTLKFENPKPGQTVGEMTWIGRTITFSAHTDGKLDASAQIKFGVTNIMAARRLPEGVVSLDGNGARMDGPTRDLLAELSRCLEERVRPWQGNVSPEQDLLVRVTLWLAEAPAGVSLGKESIDRRKAASAGAAAPSPVPCDRADEDSVDLLPGGCRFGTYADICHDAGSKLHCWRSEVVKVGCDATARCPGRCGAGCGATGSGIYARDCAEYDRCCADHENCAGPNALVCEDEWREAADDVFFAPVNCLTTGC